MTEEIPKIIHYCWFGNNPLPEEALRLIETWQKNLPDYEIRRWDESNFDVNMTEYTAQAYKAGKYAFVSDFARFWILYNYGGLYFDTDVEVIKPITDIVARGPFMGCERTAHKGAKAEALNVAPGLGLGTYPKHPFYKEMIELYGSLNFIKKDGKPNLKTVVEYTSKNLSAKGLVNSPEIQCVDGIYIYPKNYFCPMDVGTRKLTITENTRSIHYYSGTWMGKQGTIKKIVKKILGKPITGLIVSFKRRIGK